MDMSRYKFFILLFSLFSSMAVQAEERTLEQARDIAYDFMESRVMTKASSLNLEMVYDGEEILTRSALTPAYYVFNNEAGPGFVIVSGEDSVCPILGFSDSHNFKADRMPSNLRWWLRHVKRQVTAARETGLSGAVRTASVGRDVVKYETAQWDQTEPYNAQCPMDGKERSVTGCGPTAIAIAMRWREWPLAGTGTIPDYEVNVYDDNYEYVIGTKSFKGRTLGKEYDWSSMPLTDGYYGTWTTYQEEQVARLIADIGAATLADYSSQATGIFDDDVPPALNTYFGYESVEVRFKEDWYTGRTLYTDSQWLKMAKDELANGPAVFAGTDDEGGHMFVLDGYTDSDYFSVNWGWGGYSNGYYKIDALEPSEQGVGANMGSYNEMQSLIVNFKKGTSSSPDPEPEPEPEPEKSLDEMVSLKYSNGTRELTITITGEVSVTHLISGDGDTKSSQAYSESLSSESRVFVLEKDSVERTHRFVFESGTQSRTVDFIVGKEEQL